MNRFTTFFILFLLILCRTYSDDSSLVQRTVWNNPAPGYLFLGPMDNRDLAIYDNSGYKVFNKRFGFLSQGFFDFKMHPNGKLSAFDIVSNKFWVMDSSLNVIDTVGAVGYNTDFHDFLILPSGNYLVVAEADTIIDMSRIVPDGHPNCRVNNFIIQEIDYRTKRVVWQWSAIEHFSITDATEDISLTTNYIRPFHFNSMELLSDGNLLISCRHLDEITKINRQTGAIIWRMGGSKCRNNQFTFVNDTVNNFFGFSHQHDPRELPNGNILLFDNGNLKSNQRSRAVEYQIDTANRRVTKVWEYVAPSSIVSNAMGSCQRLPNGNTLIAWGGTASEGGHNYLLTEVTPDGRIALEFYANCGTYRAYRHIFKMDAVTNTITSTGLSSFRNATYNTNVDLMVSNFNGVAKYTVEKHHYAPHNLGDGGPCSVIPYRWVITKQSTNSVAGYVFFELNGLGGFSNPEELKVYYRQGEGFGAFTQLSTTYNQEYNRLEVPFAGVGEYCIGTVAIGIPKPVSPENNAINVLIPTKFVWNKFIVGEKYRLQVSASQNFLNPLFEIANISDTTYTLQNLQPGKTYFWRVRAERENCESDWSSVQSFTTIYEKISLLAPNDNSVNMPLKVQFAWSPSDNAWSYQLQLSTDDKFEHIKRDTIVYNPIVEIAGLDYYTDYFWRVRLRREEQYGMWSEVRRFQTVLAPPSLISPAQKGKNVPVEGDLSWVPVPGAMHYHIVVSKSPQFVENVLEIVDLKETRYHYTGLEFATKYYWRVRATGEYGRSEWSETFEFTTQLSPPELLRPPFADTLAPTSGILKWNVVPAATNYEVQICENENFYIGVTSYVVNSQTFVQYSGLSYSTRYYWRVRAYNSELESPWSQVSWFRTIPENYLPPPILLYPEDNTINLKMKDRLYWLSIPNANSYQVQISLDKFFNNIVLEKEVLDTSLAVNGIAYGTRYYWRVRAINSSFNSFWSDVFSFTTALREPNLLAPVNMFLTDKLPLVFEWEETSANAFYELQIAYDPAFEFIYKKQVLYQQGSYSLESVPFDTWFYWRVKTFSGVLESDWSETRQFRVKSVSSVDEKSSVVVLEEQTKGIITIYSDELISELAVYNLFGERVSHAQNVSSPYMLELRELPSGMYIISVKVNNNLFTFKIINL